MKKQPQQVQQPSNDKLGLRTETLRKMTNLDDDQLAQVGGALRPLSYVSGTC